jgi:hypothetical protein
MNSPVTLQPAGTRTIKRGVNPFAPIVKLKNNALTTKGKNLYERILDRVKPALKENKIKEAITELKARLNGGQYTEKDFGTLEWLDVSLIDCNVDIQRLLETEHVGKDIIRLFDPRILQPINVIYIKSTGRYSAWEGQQSASAFAIMQHFGLVAPGTRIQCKVVSDDLMVPGSTLIGEAVGNYGFRCINFKGRKTPDLFYLLRSMINGVRLYGSTLREDEQAEEIQQILENNHMFPAPSVDARGQQATPGMITYISGIMNIAGHDTEKEAFNTTKTDLDWALKWHDTYFNSEKGVDGGFILAFGRLHAEAREAGITFDKATEDDFARHMKAHYGSPKGFHQECQNRLKTWQIRELGKASWSDSCLTPLFVSDYINAGGTCSVPQVKGMVTYAGI